MSVAQTLSALSKSLEDAQKKDNYKEVPQSLEDALLLHRLAVLDFLKSKSMDFSSKLKLKIFETLAETGTEDCVPCVLALYESEHNLLYKKSMLFLFKNLPYKQVLRALVKKEQTIATELAPTFRRVIGNLKGVFREVFYMEEFLAGVENEKKTAHAATMMIKEPHSDYLPFLHGLVASQESVYRVSAIKVLQELGDKDSLGFLLDLFKELLEEIRISKCLKDLLPKIEQPEKEQDERFIEQLLSPLAWELEKKKDFLNRIKTDVPLDGFEALMDAYRLYSGSLRSALLAFTKGVFLGTVFIKDLRQSKILTFLDNYYTHRTEQQELCLAAMGTIAARFQLEAFPETLKSAIPEDHPNRDMIFVQLFSGYTTQSSQAILLEFLEKEPEPSHLVVLLNILGNYDLKEISPKIIDLAGSAQHLEMRKAALKILGKSSNGVDALKKLLTHESMAVRVDVLTTISDNYLTQCLPLLYQIIEGDHPNSFLFRLIETFSKFPGDQVGETIRKFLDVKYPSMIRSIALNTMLLSGGKNRFSYLFEALKNYKDKALQEMAPDLLYALSEDGSGENLLPHIIQHATLWTRFLKHVTNENVKRHLTFLMSLNWKPLPGISQWISLVRELQKDQIGLELQTKQMISNFLYELTRISELNDETKSTHRKFEALMDQVDSENEHAALRGLQTLNASFRFELVQDFDVGFDRLIEVLFRFMNRFNKPQALIQALAFLMKLHDPKSNLKMRQFLGHPVDEVSNAARRFLSQSIGVKNGRFQIKTVQVIDDSKFYCNHLVKLLEKCGYTLIYSWDPVIALEKLKRQSVDLLIVDLQMPEMDGLQFIKEARRRLIAPSVIFVMTTDQRMELILELIEEGVLQVLVKPFPSESLLDKIREVEEHFFDFM